MELDLYNTEHEKITLTKEQESCLNYAGDKNSSCERNRRRQRV